MTSNHERYLDLVAQEDDPRLLRCIADLDATCATFRLARQRDAALARSLAAHAQGRPTTPMRPAPRVVGQPKLWPAVQARRMTAGVVILLALGGLSAYVGSHGATPVSAQAVLRRAATASLAPNQAAHLRYSVSTSDGYAGTGDVWVENDASGNPSLAAQTLTMTKRGGAALDLSSRLIRTGSQTYTYTPRDNTVTIGAPDDGHGLPSDVFDGMVVAKRLSTLALAPQPAVYLLPQQQIGGVTVDVVQADLAGQIDIFYFDAQTYLLRAIDVVDGTGRTWHARLDLAQTMPTAAVPAQTFTLNASTTATVVPPQIAEALPSNCKSVVRSTALTGQTRAVRCQVAGSSQAPLTHAPMGRTNAALAAAVKAGMITQAQATTALAARAT